jgi:small subunit ribosomal protein S20
MAHSLSAKKRVRQNLKRRAINRWRKRNVRDAVKQYLETLLHGTVEQAETQLKSLYKLLDQIAASGTIHKNAAARYKSRLTARLNARKATAQAA